MQNWFIERPKVSLSIGLAATLAALVMVVAWGNQAGATAAAEEAAFIAETRTKTAEEGLQTCQSKIGTLEATIVLQDELAKQLKAQPKTPVSPPPLRRLPEEPDLFQRVDEAVVSALNRKPQCV